MRLKIISDGTVPGTRVVDEETDREVEGVIAVSWSGEVATGEVKARITVKHMPVELDVHGLLFRENKLPLRTVQGWGEPEEGAK